MLPIRARPLDRTSKPSIDTRSLVPCRFFLAGNCRNNPCPFRHDKDSTPQARPIPRHETEQDEAETEDFCRTIASAYVKFQDGGRVSKVSLLSDFSAVHLTGLPEGSSPRTVRAFLAEHKFDVPEKDIRIIYLDRSFSANVSAEDPLFSRRVCTLTQTGLMWGASRIQATPVAARMPSGHTSGRVDCKKVHVSWHKAVRTAWLNFGNSEIAGRVSRKFQTGEYKILGYKVVADAPSQASTAVFSSRGRNPVDWTVRLTQVPGNATNSNLSRAISHPSDKPRHIELAAPGYSIDDDQAATIIRSLLTRIGPVEYWEVTLESTAKRAKATARFLDETDARDAASQLDGSEVPFHKQGKLTVKMVYSAKFKVRSDLYHAVVSQANAHANVWKDKHVFLRVYPSSMLLKVEGESDTAVASAKATLDGILSGVIAKSGQVSLWDSSLGRNGNLWSSIKQQQRELGVVVVRDKVKQELRLFGTNMEKCNEAQRQLAKLFSRESHTIELDPSALFWACRGGFEKITSKLGADRATLDIVSSPKKIVISGSFEDYDLALALVNDRNVVVPSKSEAPSIDPVLAEDCSVCWTTADAPLQTACGHVYCQDCFENSCVAPSASGTDFSLLCHGNRGKCNRELSLDDLHKHLSSATFEGVLEKSFVSYVRRHPNELRFCPTADCGYVYRVTTSAKTHTCSNCLQPICTACREPHVNMTCAEYKDIQSGGYVALEKLKQAIGIKDCPKCKTPIEKVSGCNHLECLGCKIHFCWVCLKTFSGGAAVYSHMEKMHGGHIDFP
ncbi:hypothetical protein GGS23DRAFT_572531 [Durotheca rogersii]|uniref:uncharacterized protein n=1 Tax=Durotheca rogersii TaxID=419775 RepID=UPI00221F56AF|nr:uncharacterized protein GGS23DRAFT_572531 [Durotheca rogersii]KAI5862473.1 hypothetical protein GGS23DRAFT_572531 [Durotheca rogersii]